MDMLELRLTGLTFTVIQKLESHLEIIPGGLSQWFFSLYRVANFLYLLQVEGKLDPKAENKPQKKAVRSGGVSALDIDEDIYLASLILVNNVIFRH